MLPGTCSADPPNRRRLHHPSRQLLGALFLVSNRDNHSKTVVENVILRPVRLIGDWLLAVSEHMFGQLMTITVYT